MTVITYLTRPARRSALSEIAGSAARSAAHDGRALAIANPHRLPALGRLCETSGEVRFEGQVLRKYPSRSTNRRSCTE
jgi:hypothetical protein